MFLKISEGQLLGCHHGCGAEGWSGKKNLPVTGQSSAVA